MINVLYGSLATTVIVLVSLELAAVIVLFGARVIAELERQPGGSFETASASEDAAPIRADDGSA